MNLSNRIIEWLRTYLDNSGLSCFVIGVSGGIDSALVSTLCAKTGKKTILVNLPIHQKKDQVDRAKNHIKWLTDNFSNVTDLHINLTETFEIFKSLFKNPTELSLANSRSRLRMVSLYQISSMENGIVVGTGNKVEDFGIGFFTKYGDGGVDISPIADLTKTEVRELSKFLGVSIDILNAKPTDGLWDDDRTDEEQIGTTYDKLEKVMSLIEKFGENIVEDIVDESEKESFKLYMDLNKKNKHKILPIPIFKK